MGLYDGYIPTRNKESRMPFKGKSASELLTLEEANGLPEFAGRLSNETIMLDFDDAKSFETMMKIAETEDLKCRVYRTSRGGHFLFMNSAIDKCGTHLMLACGLMADIKVKSSSYEVLKFNGVKRPILRDIVEGEEYDEIPKWLFPVKSKVDFLNIGEGSRNQSLFNHILPLQAAGFSKEEARDTIRIINAYVLVNPLSDRELDVILRDESFPESVSGKFDQAVFGDALIRERHIIRLNGQLHLYRDGVYVNDRDEIERAMIQRFKGISRQKRAEVYDYIRLIAPERIEADGNLIPFRNGFLDLSNDLFHEYSPEMVFASRMNAAYDPAAYSELMDAALDRLCCGDRQIRALLEEATGYCFYRKNSFAKAFILTGEKSNGKSTFLHLLRSILGDKNVSSLDMRQLGEKFKTAELYGKLANIGDDIADTYIDDGSIFKKLVTGETVSVERKGQDSFEFSSHAKLFFSANTPPRIKDRTGAVLRRLLIIPFDAKFDESNPDYDPHFRDKIKSDEVLSYVVNLGIAGLRRLLENRKFTLPESVKAELEAYEESNNPVLSFVKECGEELIENEPTAKIYQRYCEFCIRNGFQSLSNIEFSRQVARMLNLRTKTATVKGRSVRIFIKNDT